MSAPDITIYTRHSADCRHKSDESYKRCQCRKWLRWTHNGKRCREAAGTRSWVEAEEKRRETLDRLSGRVAPEASKTHLLRECIELFLADKAVQGIDPDGLARYKRELSRLQAHCEAAGVYAVEGVTKELLTKYAATWSLTYKSSQTRSVVRARCRAFLRYCWEAQWVARIPPLPKIKVDVPPTMPLTPDEFDRLLDTVGELPDPVRRARGRSLFLLMRYSGLAIGDALRLRRDQLQHDAARGVYRVVTARQKTGIHVSVPIPPAVALELLGTPNGTWTHAANGHTQSGHPDYLFWDGKSQVIVRTFLLRLVAPVFKAAGLPRANNMTTHRLRDTFAVDLLEKGVPLEEVSKLLGHESIKTTEKHYAKWVKGRQDRLDSLVMGTWN